MISTVCIYVEDISENESICKKGFSTDKTCWTGKGSNCHYYSNYYDPSEDEELAQREDDSERAADYFREHGSNY